jgi:hypothetical protein
MMKSIVCTYPDFRELPKSIRQMLVVSETEFFEEAHLPQEKENNRDVFRGQWWTPGQTPFAMRGQAAVHA